MAFLFDFVGVLLLVFFFPLSLPIIFFLLAESINLLGEDIFA